MARPPPGTGQPPISFKTVPGRHRTQKWNVAPSYDYSGDDWGGYDAYEDYEPQPLPGQQQHGYVNPAPHASQSQSAHPALQSQPPYGQQSQPGQVFGRQNRQQSFDHGDETRQFSGPAGYGPAGMGMDPRGGSPARSAGSGGRMSNDSPRPSSRARDFTNPEQVPPPLNTMTMGGTRGSPGPATAPPGSFPPRKSSASAGSPALDPGAKEKELPTIPFVRPSDIYKRMEAERERERKSSMDSSSRPSLDSTSGSAELQPPPQGQRPLSSVEEGEDVQAAAAMSDVDMPGGFGEPEPEPASGPEASSSFLPPVKEVSAFGSDIFHPPARAGTTDSEQTPTSPQARALQPATTSFNSMQTTPVATRAPPGADPAADILAERTAKRAPPGLDPAADILAERTATRPPPSTDPAADILAERTHEVPISQIGRPSDSLSHQPSQASQASQGYRSMVHRAFDRQDDQNSTPATPVSHDGSQLGASGDVSRSNTQSTSSISPIMSRVPSAATAKMQQERLESVPTIAEEQPQARASSESARKMIARKPSPSVGGGEASTGPGMVEKGYRRSLDPPSSDNSPAQTPGLVSAGRTISGGFTADTFTAPEDDLPTRGRARAGTDYSVREADLAHNVNASPEKGEFDSQAAEAEHSERESFLHNHSISAAGPAQSPIAGSGRDSQSPSKGRVRDLADRYEESSRRNSQTLSQKSSWSNFRGSDENLPGKVSGTGAGVRRSGTGATQQSNLVSESDYGGVEEGGIRDSEPEDDATREQEMPRPALRDRDMEQSFRPHLPGEWVSTTSVPTSRTFGNEDTTPSRSVGGSGFLGAQHTPRPSQQIPQEEQPVDLTPTTRKVPLEGESYSQPPASFLGQAKNAGDALGAALLSSVGYGHQTRDFGSAEPATEIEQPGTDDRRLAGAVETEYFKAPKKPWELNRGDTGASVMTTVSNVSMESDAPPTPLAKDTPTPQPPTPSAPEAYFNYGSSRAVAPLRTGKSPDRDWRPQPSALSTLSGSERLQRDDSLRREIVRSLDSPQTRQDDRDLTQDALDGPDNVERISQGKNALPAHEINDESPSKPPPLQMRFSWETRPDAGGAVDTPSTAPAATAPPEIWAPVPRVREPEPDSSPEIKPEMPYERPRSRGLHIMNASHDGSSDEEERVQRPRTPVRDPLAAERGMETSLPVGAMGLGGGLGSRLVGGEGPVSPISKSQENLHERSVQAARESGEVDGEGQVQELMPSPMSEGSVRLPSYYIQDASGLELPGHPSRESTAAPEAIRDASIDDPTTVDSPPPEKEASPTSPLSKQKIPPFREILAIKSSDARIKAYDETRQTFADTNTGLSTWLSDMLAQNPEYASLSTAQVYRNPAALQSSGTFSRGHKHAPSLAMFTKQFAGGSSDVGRSASVNAGAGGCGSSSDVGPEVPPKTQVDMDKLQQRGKDLMKGASVFGGRAQAGAKGLFAKGRSRFGTQRESKGGAGWGGGGVGSGGGSKDPNPPSTSTPSPPPAPAAAALTPSTSLLPPYPVSESLATLAPPSQQPSRSHSRSPPSQASASASAPPARTPSSLSSASRPLSRTFSRLRERSRSLSSTGGRRSKSRPASLVLTTTANSDLRDDPSGVTGFVAAMERSAAVISPWDEPGLGGGSGSATAPPVRLGVLPSPAADGFSVILESPPKTAGSGSSRPMDGAVPEQGRARHGRGESEVSFLPSLERGGAESPGPAVGSPVSPVFPTRDATQDEEGEEEEELYESTPKKLSPAATWMSAMADELFESTPLAEEESREAGVGRDVGTGSEDGVQVGTEQSGGGAEEEEEEDEVEVVEGKDADQAGVPLPETTEIDTQEAKNAARVEITEHPQTTEDVSTPLAQQVSDEKAWDRRSAVSSNYDDVEEDPKSGEKSSSRRSSVSSLDHVEEEDEEEEEQPPVMSSQAVPAGPIITTTAPEESRNVQEERFMNRPYRYGAVKEERPSSFTLLDRDSSGAPVQESLEMGQTSSRDLTGFSGPPAGGSPFQQQPATRSSVVDTRPKRFSGFIKGRRPTLTSPAVESASGLMAPAPSTISDHFGLEGVQDDADNVAVDEVPPQRASQPDHRLDEKQAKRRSGLFDAFKRSASVSKTETSRHSSTVHLDAQQEANARPTTKAPEKAIEQDSRRGTLKKPPQRASTSAAEPEQKKKRFSGLGSIFGRSSTTGHKSEKGKKLTKAQSSSRDNSLKQGLSKGGEYEQFEARKRQQAGDSRQGQSNTYPPPTLGAQPSLFQESDTQPRQSNTYPPPVPVLPAHAQYRQPEIALMTSPEEMPPPPEEWLDPISEQSTAQSQASQQNQPRYRRLHSNGNRRDLPFISAVPEAFKPINYSYNRPVIPVGLPPDEQRHGAYSQPTSPTSPDPTSSDPDLWPRRAYSQQAVFSQRSAGPRHSSQGSSASQVSGQSDWQRGGWQPRGSSPSISPVSRNGSDGFPPGRNVRVGSITEEMARSPAKEYPDQQTPWSINIPRAGPESYSSSRVPPNVVQGESRPAYAENYMPASGYNDAYPCPRPGAYQPQRRLPISPGSPGYAMPTQRPLAPAAMPMMDHAPVFNQPRQMNPRFGGDAYPSPPLSPESPSFSDQPVIRPSQGRYYAGPGSRQGVSAVPPKDPYGPQRHFSIESEPSTAMPRPSAGYTGRGDDPTVGEESVVMSAVSYPGQEWQPDRWSE